MHSVLRIIKYYWLVCFVFLLAACSKDSASEVALVFPEKQVMDVVAGDSRKLAFDAPAGPWELASDQPVWCRLSYQEQKNLPSVVGNAGKAEVTIDITDDNANFTQSARADITLCIGNQQQVICTVVRKDIDTYVVLRQNGEVIPEEGTITIGSSGAAELEVETNFGQPDVSHADWFDVEYTDGKYTLTLNDNISKKYSIDSSQGFIDFTLSKTRAVGNHQYKVCFSGMDPKAISIRGFQYKPQGLDVTYRMSAFNWEVSADGKMISAVNQNGDIVEAGDKMQVTVDALDDKIVFADLVGDKYNKVKGSEWFHITQDKSNVTITVDALPSETTSRGANIYAFPETVWNEIANATVSDAEQHNANAVFCFTQTVPSQGFEISYYDWASYEMMELPVTVETSKDILAAVKAIEPAAENVYHADGSLLPVNSYSGLKSMTALLLLASDEWSAGSTSRNYRCVDLSTGEDLITKNGYSVDPGLDYSNKWQFDMAWPSSHSTPILLIVYDGSGNGKVLKVLVIDN